MNSISRVAPRRDALMMEVADAQESSNLRFWTLIDRVRVQVHRYLLSIYDALSRRTQEPAKLIGDLLSNLSEAALQTQAQAMMDALSNFESEYANAAVYIVRRVMLQESPQFADAVMQAARDPHCTPPHLDVSLDEPVVFLTRVLKQAIASPEVTSGDWFLCRDMAARVDAIKNAVTRAMMSSVSGEFRCGAPASNDAGGEVAAHVTQLIARR